LTLAPTVTVILGLISVFVGIAALVARRFVRATIFGLIYPLLLFVWPPQSLFVELVVVAALIGIDWLFARVDDEAQEPRPTDTSHSASLRATAKNDWVAQGARSTKRDS